MLRSSRDILFVAFLAAGCVCCPAEAFQKDKGKPGVRWQYKAVDERDKEIETGTFRAHDSKIFRGDNQVGTYDDSVKGKVKVTISKGKLKGVFDLHAVAKKKNPTWKGEWKREDGSKAKMTVEFFKN